MEQRGVELVAAGLSEFLGDLNKGNRGVDSFAIQTARAADITNAFSDAMSRVKVDDLTNKISQQEKTLGLLRRELDLTSEKYGEGSIQADRKRLSIEKLKTSIDSGKRQLSIFKDALDAEGKAAADAVDPLNRSGNAVDDMGRKVADSGPRFDAFRAVAVGALAAVGVAAVELAGNAVRTVGAFVTDSVGLAGDFQAGMNNFAAVTNLDTSGLENFRDLFLDLGAKLPVSTSQVQEAATELAKGGIEPATIAAGGLESALRFAGAAGLELSDAATIAAKVTGGWTKVNATATEKAEFMASAMDTMTKASNATTTDVDELALGLYNVQGAAQNAGLGFQETVTTLAAVSSVFNSSAEAGNSFKNFIARLQPSTAPAVEAMEALGLYSLDAERALKFLIDEGVVPASTSLADMKDPAEEINGLFNKYLDTTTNLQKGTKEYNKALQDLTGTFSHSAFYDTAGNFIGMEQAAGKLQEATKNLTDEEKARYLQTIFGNDAMGVAARLAQMGAEGYANVAASMEKQAGVQATATIKQQGFNVAMDNARGSMEALQITAGTYLLPILENLLNNVISPGINAVRDFTTALFSASDPFAFMVQQINTVIPGFALFVSGAQTAVSFISENFGPIMAGAFGVLAAALYTVVIPAFTAWATGAIGAATATMVALAPVVLPIAAIGAAAAALYLAWDTNFLGIRDTLTTFWNTTGQPIFESVRGWLVNTLTAAISTLAGFWTGTLQPAMQAVSSYISTNVIPLLGTLGGAVFTTLGSAIGTLAGYWTTTLQPALSAVWTFINTNLVPLFGALAAVHMAAVGVAGTALAGVFQNVILPGVSAVKAFLADQLRPAMEVISNTVVPAVKNAFSELATYWNTTLAPMVRVIASYFSVDLTGGIRGVSDAIRDAIGWLRDLANSLNTIDLPDWMTPGSPTPWENGLRGVSSAMRELTAAQMPRLETQLAALVKMEPAVARYSPPATMPNVSSTSSTVVNQNFVQNVQTNSPAFATQSYRMMRILAS